MFVILFYIISYIEELITNKERRANWLYLRSSNTIQYSQRVTVTASSYSIQLFLLYQLYLIQFFLFRCVYLFVCMYRKSFAIYLLLILYEQ